MIDLQDYIKIGYFITRWAEKSRPDYAPSDLIPDRIISLSGCIAEFAPDVWAWSGNEISERVEENAQFFGVEAERFPEIQDWIMKHAWPDGINFYEIWRTLPMAREFIRQFLGRARELLLVGVGLPRELAPAVLEYWPWKPEERRAGVGEPREHEIVSRNESLEPGGEILGFDVIVYNIGFSCSWFCNGLQEEVWEKYKIRPNHFGLLKTREEAAQVAEYANRDDVGSEPGLWVPLLVVRYPVDS